MSITSRLFAAAAAITLAGGLSLAAASAADAATPSCGSSCIDLFTSLYGPGFVPEVAGQGASAGQPITLAAASGSNPEEDFQLSYQGLVSDFIAAGLISPGLSA